MSLQHVAWAWAKVQHNPVPSFQRKPYLLHLLLTLFHLFLKLLLGIWVVIALQFAVGLPAGCQLLFFAGWVVSLLHCLHLWIQPSKIKKHRQWWQSRRVTYNSCAEQSKIGVWLRDLSLSYEIFSGLTCWKRFNKIIVVDYPNRHLFPKWFW